MSVMPQAFTLSLLAHAAFLTFVLNKAYVALTEPVEQVSTRTIYATLVEIPVRPKVTHPPQPLPKPKPLSKSKPEAGLPVPKAKPKPEPKPKQVIRTNPNPMPQPKPEAPPKVEAVAKVVPQAIPPKQPPPVARDVTPLKQVDMPKANEVMVKVDPPEEAKLTESPPTPLIEPRYRSKPSPPKYPRKARRKRQQGTVLIRILVSPAGENLKINVHHSSGFDLLDQAAVDAVTAWQFEPASLSGKNVLAWVEVPVEFKLQ